MRKHIEFGSTQALYGCVGMTAHEAYIAISKMKCITAWVPEGSTSIPFCDVGVIDTVQTLIACKPYINSDMVIVVCDSAPAIASLKNVIPYDYEGDIFSNFSLKAPPRSLPLKDSKPTAIELNNNDIVREAIKSIVVVGFLQDFNSVTAKMNKTARNILRAKLCALILGKETVDSIALFIRSLSIEADDFIAKLGSAYFKSLRNAIYYNYKGHSIEYVKKKFGVTDSYEITFFVKMLRENR